MKFMLGPLGLDSMDFEAREVLGAQCSALWRLAMCTGTSLHGSAWARAGRVEVFYSYAFERFSVAKAIE